MILPGSGSTSSNIAAAAYCPKPRRSSASTPKGAWRKGLAKLQAPISAFPIPLTTCSGATTTDAPVKTKTEKCYGEWESRAFRLSSNSRAVLQPDFRLYDRAALYTEADLILALQAH